MNLELFDLTGRSAIVTGGNSGIGLGMAQGLVSAGADVAIWGTNEEKTRAAVEILRESGGTALGVRCDVGDEADVRRAHAETTDALGPIHACFANAGVSGGSPFSQMTLEEWRRVTRVNLDGAFLTFREVASGMVEHGQGGSLVVTSSGASIDGAPRGEHYAASKGGVNAMIRGLAVELARHGIRANTIVPGWIETAMTEGRLDAQPMVERVLKRVPARRWGTPEDFWGVAVFLASDASAYMTGQMLVVDGGYTVF